MINFCMIMITKGMVMTGRLGRAVRAWVKIEKDGAEPGRLVMLELIVAAADLADRARAAGQDRRELQALMRLSQWVGAVDRDRGGGGEPAGDDWADELAAVLRSGPSLGDAEESGAADVRAGGGAGG